MMNKALATTSTTPVENEEDDVKLYVEPLRVDPHNIVFDFVGLDSRQAMIRLPIGVVADDLNSNLELFRNVQQSRSTSLRKFDRLVMVAYDESWLAEAFVAEAGPTSVTLAKPRITPLPPRNETLLNDGTYKVVWMGTGYSVVRIRDNFRMTPPFANKVLAERALVQLYPQKS